jgi:hypothetical protein
VEPVVCVSSCRRADGLRSRPTLSPKVAVGLFLAALTAILTGCPPPNATDVVGVRFNNDLRRPVLLKLCGNTECTDFNNSDHVPAGGSVGENISTDHLLTRWMVADTRGTKLGCLPLEFGTVTFSHADVSLSQMVPCPGKTPLSVRHK